MGNYLRHTRWFRILLIKLTYRVPESVGDRILDWLYPDDLFVQFQ